MDGQPDVQCVDAKNLTCEVCGAAATVSLCDGKEEADHTYRIINRHDFCDEHAPSAHRRKRGELIDGL